MYFVWFMVSLFLCALNLAPELRPPLYLFVHVFRLLSFTSPCHFLSLTPGMPSRAQRLARLSVESYLQQVPGRRHCALSFHAHDCRHDYFFVQF